MFSYHSPPGAVQAPNKNKIRVIKLSNHIFNHFQYPYEQNIAQYLLYVNRCKIHIKNILYLYVKKVDIPHIFMINLLLSAQNSAVWVN